jgi:hypothetical protein
VTRGVRVVDQPNKVTVVEDVVVVQVAAGIQGPQGPQGVQGPPGLDGTGAPVFGQVAKMCTLRDRRITIGHSRRVSVHRADSRAGR